MSEKKHLATLMAWMISVSLLTAIVVSVISAEIGSRVRFQTLSAVCGEIVREQPEAVSAVLHALKEYRSAPIVRDSENILLAYGYQRADFQIFTSWQGILSAAIGFLVGGGLFVGILLYRNRKDMDRIRELETYLELVNAGGAGKLIHAGEDEFSKLQDEIDKTVTQLYQTREAAVDARNHFADNLLNIAHQLKTPVTAMSLQIQMMRADADAKDRYLDRLDQQLSRLTHLEEALFIMARIDAGTLSLERHCVDVFTLLTLASDQLWQLMDGANVGIDMEENGECSIMADMEWTMEAFANLFKNCMEHSPSGGMIHCTYEQNLLYTGICLWDEGEGFEKDDMPHLFQRFYRGKRSVSGGIGVGLALAKEIIERQNGTIRAWNRPEGGACFEVRFYHA